MEGKDNKHRRLKYSENKSGFSKFTGRKTNKHRDMGQKGINILDLDVQELISKLNAALSEEWLAYYQYWIGARLMEGPMRSEIEPELLLHATQEFGHAELVVGRIIQLGGTPVLHPADWFKLARCEYDAPSDPYVEVILEQNLKGERCAIQRYKEIADFTNGKDFTTHQMVTTILNEELEHEQDIEDWLTDLARMKDDLRKFRM
jgi:bacterioferritin